MISAILFVDFNKHNRDFSLSKAQSYAQQMQLGYWRLVHQGIAFYPSKKLADGQHRIAAVFLSGTTQAFTVFRNFSEDAMEAIDTGKRRTAGDAFGITGLVPRQYSKVAGAIVDTVMKYESLRLHAKSISPSIYEQKDWAKAHLNELMAALLITETLTKGDPVLTKAEAGSIVLAMLIGGYTREFVEGWVGDVLQGMGRYQDSPAVDLFRQYTKAKEGASPKGKLTREEKLALAFKGALYFYNHAATGGVKWKKGKEPLPPPVPPARNAARQAAE